jgi:hypothetical protein
LSVSGEMPSISSLTEKVQIIFFTRWVIHGLFLIHFRLFKQCRYWKI